MPCFRRFVILVPLLDLKFLAKFASSVVRTSNRRHEAFQAAIGGDRRRIAELATTFNLCDYRPPQRTNEMASDEEVGHQILSIFMKHKVVAGGVLRRNHFIDVRDADFQRGLNKAVDNQWLKVSLRDRYTYELTDAGLAEGLRAATTPNPSA